MTQTLDNRTVQNGQQTPAAKSDFEQLLDRPFKKPTELLSEQLGVPQAELVKVLRQMMPQGFSDRDFMAFIQIAAKYQLNPFTREIYPMPKKGGGVQVIVGIDGWVSIVQRNRKYDGVEFHEVETEGGVPVVTICTMYVKGQGHPVIVAERFKECRRGTDPWNQMPFRMLRHKAYIQAARLAFGINGIADEEEGAKAAGFESVEAALQAAAAAAQPTRKEANPFTSIQGDDDADTDTDPYFPDDDQPAGGETPTSLDAGHQAAPVPTEAPAPAAPAQAPTTHKRPGPKTEAKKQAPAPDGPTDPKDIAEVFVATKTAKELRQYIDTVKAMNAALVAAELKMAGVLNIEHAVDDEIRNAAWNVKFAMEGGRAVAGAGA